MISRVISCRVQCPAERRNSRWGKVTYCSLMPIKSAELCFRQPLPRKAIFSASSRASLGDVASMVTSARYWHTMDTVKLRTVTAASDLDFRVLFSRGLRRLKNCDGCIACMLFFLVLVAHQEV